MRPNTMNKYGAVLDDFGLETMLDKLMDDFIRPISRGNTFEGIAPWKLFSCKMQEPLFFSCFCFWYCVVFFPEVGGATLDSHHGFVVEYGIDRDVELGRF